MHGIGNDYIFIDNICDEYKMDFSCLSKKLSRRHFSVGSDGIIVILKSKTCDAKIHIFNADGSKAKMCGNALRCVAFYLYKKLGKKEVIIQVVNRKIKCKILSNSNNKATVEVCMGRAKLLSTHSFKLLKNLQTLNVVSLGNKHAVVFVKEFNFSVQKWGKTICDSFDGGINVEFVKIQKDNILQIKVYERGSGITYACGSGACASAYAYCKAKKINGKIIANLEKGQLEIYVKNSQIKMTGQAKFVYFGEVEIDENY